MLLWSKKLANSYKRLKGRPNSLKKNQSRLSNCPLLSWLRELLYLIYNNLKRRVSLKMIRPHLVNKGLAKKKRSLWSIKSRKKNQDLKKWIEMKKWKRNRRSTGKTKSLGHLLENNSLMILRLRKRKKNSIRKRRKSMVRNRNIPLNKWRRWRREGRGKLKRRKRKWRNTKESISRQGQRKKVINRLILRLRGKKMERRCDNKEWLNQRAMSPRQWICRCIILDVNQTKSLYIINEISPYLYHLDNFCPSLR